MLYCAFLVGIGIIAYFVPRRILPAQTPTAPPLPRMIGSGQMAVISCQALQSGFSGYDGVICVVQDSVSKKEFVVSMWNGGVSAVEVQ